MGFRPYDPNAGGGGASRVPVLVSGSPFADLTALDTWSQANPTELLNNSTQYATAQVGTAPNFITYEWIGPDMTYQANSWANMTSLTQDQTDAVNSIVNAPDDMVLLAKNGEVAASVMEQLADGTLETSGTIRAGTNTLELGLAHKMSSSGENVTITNVGTAIDYHPVWQTFATGEDVGTLRLRAGAGGGATPITVPVNTVDNGTITNPLYSFVVPSIIGEEGQTALTSDVVVDATSTLTNIRVRVAINGVDYSTLKLASGTVGNFTFTYEPPFDFRVGQTLTFEITSLDGDVVLRGDTVSGIPVLSTDIYTWDDVPIALAKNLNAQTLAQTLANGNTTGGNDISISNNDAISLAVGHDDTAINLQSDASTATIIDVDANLLTTGGFLDFSTSANSADIRRLVRVASTSQLATGTTLMRLEQAGANELAIDIDGGNIDQFTNTTSGTAYQMTLDDCDTGVGMAIVGDALTTGALMTLDSSSNDTSTRSLLEITQNSVTAPGAKCATFDNEFADGLSLDMKGRVFHTYLGNNFNAYELLANNMTSGTGLRVEADDLTDGRVAQFLSSSNDTTARNLVEITNSNGSATGAVPLTIEQQANNEALQVLMPGVTTGRGALFQGNSATAGTVVDIEANALTSGNALLVSSNSTSPTGRDVVAFSNDNVAATGATVLDLTQQANTLALEIVAPGVTNGTGSRATFNSLTGSGTGFEFISNSSSIDNWQLARFKVDNPLATGSTALSVEHDYTNGLGIDLIGRMSHTFTGDIFNAYEFFCNNMTTGTGLRMEASALTTGTMAEFYSNSISNASRSLVRITNDNTLANQCVPLRVTQDADTSAVFIDQNGNNSAINIDAENTSAPGVFVRCDNLTSGRALWVYSNGTNTTGRNLVQFTNDDPAATGCTTLYVQQDANGAPGIDVESAGIATTLKGGQINIPTTVNAATYSMLTEDSRILVDHTATAAVTVTLPSAQTVNGREVKIKDSGGNAVVNNITLATEGAETIDGAASFTMNINYQAVTLISNGTNWFIL